MKQKLQNLFFLFLLGTIGAKAQGPVITAAGFNPVIGDSYLIKYANQITKLPNLSGGDNVWDVSSLIDEGNTDTVIYVSPKGLSFLDSFPTSNIARIELGIVTFYQKDSNAWGPIGDYPLDSIVNSGENFTSTRYSSRLNFMVYPMSVNTNFSDSFQYFQRSSWGQTSTSTQYDTLIGVGYGKLKIPSGNYDSVVCVYFNGGINGFGGRFFFITNGVHYPLLEVVKTTTSGLWQPYYLSGSPLPLQISSFNVVWQSKMPYLQWEAANTENTKAFNIQRSVDGHSFSTVGQVGVSGGISYHFEDNYIPTSTVYYRLQQVDKNGQTFYSSTARLTVNSQPITVFPNPAKGTIHVSIPSGTAAHVMIYDAIGRLVYENKTYSSVQPIATDIWSKGTYLVKVKDNEGWKVSSFEKE